MRRGAAFFAAFFVVFFAAFFTVDFVAALRVAAFFAQQRGGPGLLVGAVPFEPRADDALYQPERLLPALPLQPRAAPALQGPLQAEPAAQDYAAAVAAAVKALRAPDQDLH